MKETIPLSTGFFITSIIGWFLSVFVIYNRWPSWGFAFALIFIIMFIAAFISMTYTSVDHKMILSLQRAKREKRK